MVQYLTILLDDTSTSYCHYSSVKKDKNLIPIATLKEGISYGMKENLNIQFVYPEYPLSKEYLDTIDSIDHIDIKPLADCADADVIVMDKVEEVLDSKATIVLRISKREFFDNVESITQILSHTPRLNIVLLDIDTFSEEDFSLYETCLKTMATQVEKLYTKGIFNQLNLLTDRMMLTEMNNCGAGETSITLAPDGNFYICPAFYLADGQENYGIGKTKFNIGNLEEGLNIKNAQLYKLDHAPLCRICDAFHCKRCVWLNRKTTLEVNTPSHEQCVVSHIERNVSKDLLLRLKKQGDFLSNMPEIKNIDYLDPFDVKEEW